MLIEEHVTIAAPLDRVWAIQQDPAGWPAFIPHFYKIEPLGEDAIALGRSFRIHAQGQRPSIWTVTACEPPRRFVWETTAMPGFRMIAEHVLEPHPAGCKVTLRVTTAGPVALVLGPLLRGVMSAAVAREAHGLRSFCEAQLAA